ncbi:MAG: Pr6Pr family membrane protein [Microbacteriaceae bacterium]
MYPEYFMIDSARPLHPVGERRRAQVLGIARLVMAAVCSVALVARYFWGVGSLTFEPGNFFAYLTIQSNIAFAIVIAIDGFFALSGRVPRARMEALRAGVITCTVTAGIVFALIVQQSSVRAIRVDVPWSDVVLHFILPVIALADWAISPRTARTTWRIIPLVLLYTCGWGGVTMLRGSITGWYPYYFLDPNQTSGIGEFVLLSSIALAVFATVGSLVVGISALSARWRVRRRVRGSAALSSVVHHRLAPR